MLLTDTPHASARGDPQGDQALHIVKPENAQARSRCVTEPRAFATVSASACTDFRAPCAA